MAGRSGELLGAVGRGRRIGGLRGRVFARTKESYPGEGARDDDGDEGQGERRVEKAKRNE